MIAALDDVEPQVREAQVLSIGRHGYHRLFYRDWGDPDAADVVFCVHGLTRNHHDFDPLASVLSRDRRVICPDLVGRGRSEWLRDPRDYHLVQYSLDATVLAAQVGTERFDWIGSSLGGMVGIALAGMENSPIRHLVVNDIAPEIPVSAILRLNAYVGQDTVFPSLEAVEAYFRTVFSTFGPMTDADWRRMAENGSVETDQGLVLTYDPGIKRNFRRFWMVAHVNLWRYWDRIRCPVLILRGTESDFLTPSLADQMRQRLPHAELIEFEGIGHAPTLNVGAQIDPVASWLRS